MKDCRKCGKKFKPTEHQMRKRDYICSPCNSQFQFEYRKRRAAEGKPVHGGVASAEWWKQYTKKYYADPDNRKRIAGNMRRYRNDPQLRMRHEARWQARRALKSGVLKRQPCAKCGNQKTQMHHQDYYKPLEVVFLCQKCHTEEHKQAV